MDVTAFGLDDLRARARYDALFEACPEAFIQQSAWWAEAIAPLGPDEPIFLLAEQGGRAVGGLPCYLYRGPAGSILTSVPQAGPLGGVFVLPGEAGEPVYAGLLEAAMQIARARQCIAFTIITNPLADDLAFYERYLGADLVFENFTQVVPLERVIGEGQWVLEDNAERNPGRTIRKARGAGLSSSVATSLQEFNEWYSVHQRRHVELGLEPLRRELLEGIYVKLRPRGRAFLQLVRAADKIVAGCLYVHHRHVCDAFIMSMDRDHAASAPNYLLQEQAFFTMSRLGIRWMNWQSSPRRGDGVFNFKRQWGSEERSYYFVTRLLEGWQSIRSLGEEGIRSGYPGHFVVPFGALQSGFAQTRFRKA